MIGVCRSFPPRETSFLTLVQDDATSGLVLPFLVLICVSQMPPGPAGLAGEWATQKGSESGIFEWPGRPTAYHSTQGNELGCA